MGLREKANVLGAVLAYAIYINIILIFVVRLMRKPALEQGLGLVLMIAAVPLAYLLAVAPSFRRPVIYYLQIGLMLAFLFVELFLDYVLKIDFRNTRWMTIAYVMVFFSGSGGMIGVASQAGRAWAIPAIVLFLVMTALAFIQRAITGM
jgi:hypothetical protein